MHELRVSSIMSFVARPSEEPQGKEAGAKRPEAWQLATLRTFCGNDAAIRLRHRPQQMLIVLGALNALAPK
jgi:hypothetical protein